jgi:multidrug efflux pump subunit AcrB
VIAESLLKLGLALRGTVGALLGLNAVPPVTLDNDLYVQIGPVMLIAMSAKNAILNVRVARERYPQGLGQVQAVVEAARVRFRPGARTISPTWPAVLRLPHSPAESVHQVCSGRNGVQ